MTQQRKERINLIARFVQVADEIGAHYGVPYERKRVVEALVALTGPRGSVRSMVALTSVGSLVMVGADVPDADQYEGVVTTLATFTMPIRGFHFGDRSVEFPNNQQTPAITSIQQMKFRSPRSSLIRSASPLLVLLLGGGQPCLVRLPLVSSQLPLPGGAR